MRACGRSGRAETRRQEVRHYPRPPLRNPATKEKLVTELPNDFRTVRSGDAISNDFVVPYYLDDRKRRCRSPASADLLRFRQSLHMYPESYPLSGGLLMACASAMLAFRHHSGSRGRGQATRPLTVHEVQEGRRQRSNTNPVGGEVLNSQRAKAEPSTTWSSPVTRRRPMWFNLASSTRRDRQAAFADACRSPQRSHLSQQGQRPKFLPRPFRQGPRNSA